MSRSEPTESFLALLRAAEEGEVEETMAEVIARFETSEDGDGDELDGRRGLGGAECCFGGGSRAHLKEGE